MAEKKKKIYKGPHIFTLNTVNNKITFDENFVLTNIGTIDTQQFGGGLDVLSISDYNNYYSDILLELFLENKKIINGKIDPSAICPKFLYDVFQTYTPQGEPTISSSGATWTTKLVIPQLIPKGGHVRLEASKMSTVNSYFYLSLYGYYKKDIKLEDFEFEPVIYPVDVQYNEAHSSTEIFEEDTWITHIWCGERNYALLFESSTYAYIWNNCISHASGETMDMNIIWPEKRKTMIRHSASSYLMAGWREHPLELNPPVLVRAGNVITVNIEKDSRSNPNPHRWVIFMGKRRRV